MTAIEAVSVYLPPARVPIRDLAERLGLTDRQVRMFVRYYGLSEVRLEPGGTLTDLLTAAAGRLDVLPGQEHRVRYVLQARTMDSGVPYPENPLHEVRDAFGLGHATAFTVTQHACASGLLALDMAGRLLADDGDPDALALVFAGEKAFTPTVQLIPATTVMGEGTVCVVVRPGGGRDRLLSYATRTYGRFHGGLFLSPELAQEFETVYVDALVEVMTAALDRAGLGWAQLDLLLPHNVNRLSWARLCEAVNFPVERVLLDNVPVTGHCFGADTFINYATAVELGRLRPGDRYLMAAVGLGATFSAMVFEH
ncbi:ketoacyl-ACP synthase III family protein [Micromonospora sp. CPCC 205539]|uniref:ketoacyl-ACP synthase III family protein n=1 Tax=Micromonospora sp. CPCC 205539 TaxID=3122408 RepID=UPI002FEEBF9C